MPAHSFLISSAQGLPACATAAEPDSSSAVSTTNPDRILATLDFLDRDSKMRIRIYPKTGFSPRHGKPTVFRKQRSANSKQDAATAIPNNEPASLALQSTGPVEGHWAPEGASLAPACGTR